MEVTGAEALVTAVRADGYAMGSGADTETVQRLSRLPGQLDWLGLGVSW